MSGKGYIQPEELLFSCIFGGGVYKETGQYVQDPIGGDDGKGHLSPLLKNVITGEEFFIKRLDCSDFMYNRYRDRILKPPKRNHILWPTDMIMLGSAQMDKCNLTVEQEYSDASTQNEEQNGIRALLFPYAGYPKRINAIRRLGEIGQKNWKNASVRKIAVKILEAIDEINRCGYIYGDIHLSRIFFDERNEVYFNFSNLVFSYADTYSDEAEIICSMQTNSYPIEFADPSIIQGKQRVIDFQAQNFSLCSLLFYLFFGRYAYDGLLLDDHRYDGDDRDLSSPRHYIKFREYHKMPVFIFDSRDTRNELGVFDEEQQIIDLWQECPGELKDLFASTLKQENAERTIHYDNPTPRNWLNCLNSIGWIEYSEEV